MNTIIDSTQIPSDKRNVYVAFSIAGSNCFITASKEIRSMAWLSKEFTQVKSRRPDYDPNKGIKLNWTGLMNKKTKKPYICPIWVRRRFNQLKREGWTVNDANFIAHHGLK